MEMTKNDLRAWSGAKKGTPNFSVQALIAARKKQFDTDARERAKELLEENPPDYPTYIDDQTYTIEPMSVVGPVVSYLETSDGYSPGAAHPYHSTSMVAFDITRNAEASLLDFYSEKQIVDALKSDPWIRKYKVPPGVMASI